MNSNTFKIVILLSSLTGFVVLVGSWLGGPTGTVIGLLLGLGIVGASYWSSDRLAVKAARATEVAPGQLDWLRNDLAEIARRADMPVPRLFISPDPVATAISAIANMAMFAGMFGGNSDEDGPGRALATLDHTSKQIPMHIDPAHATAYIVNPLTGGQANFAKLFMTHPPMDERISRLLGAPVDARLAR